MPRDPRDSRYWRKLRERVLARDSYICGYCGDEATTVDHILPVVSNPELALNPDNCISACKKCNSRKGSRSLRSFLAPAFTPPDCANSVFAPKTASIDHELPRSRTDQN